MKRRYTVAFAIVASVLLATMPTAVVGSTASDELVVGGQYSTGSELAGGGLTEMSVSGTGENAEVVANDPVDILDGFDDGNTNGWTVKSSGSFTAVQSPQAGSHAAEFSPDTGQWQNYVNRTKVTTTGNVTISGYVQDHQDSGEFIDDDSPWLSLATNSSAQYGVRLSPVNDLVELIKITDSGKVRLDSASASLSLDTYYYVSFTRNQRTGEMEAAVETTSGSPVATLAETDESFTPTTAGVGAFRNTPTFDEIQITESGVAASYYFQLFRGVSSVDAAAINITAVQDVRDATVEVEYRDGPDSPWQTGNSSSITTAGNMTLSVPESDASTWRIYVVYMSDGPNPELSIGDGSILFTNHAPSVDNSSASPTGDLTNRGTTFEIDLSDQEFSSAQGETLTAELFVDGQSVGTDTLQSNGTASVTATLTSGGQHSYHWVVSDSYGAATTSQKFTVSVPSELRIYNESAPNKLVDNATVNIQFYGGQDGGAFTVQRTTNDGIVNMSGLPANEEFIVVVDSAGYHNRRIYVESLYEQANVFLLPQSKKAVYNIFKIDDKSGAYPPGETRLIIQRALNRSGNFTWYTVSGDFFGSTNEHKTYLRYNVRYRLIIVNDAGDRRMMGPYFATDEQNPKIITVSSIVVRPPDGQQYYATAWVGQEDPTPDNNVTERLLRFTYSDPTNSTSSLSLLIHERGNESNVLAKVDVDDVGTSYAYTYTLEGENATGKTWIADWSATRNGNTVGEEIPIGQRGGIPLPMDSEWLARFGLVALPIVAALASERIATLGAMGVVAFAGILMISGIWPIPVVLWFAALITAVGGHALTMARRGSVYG